VLSGTYLESMVETRFENAAGRCVTAEKNISSLQLGQSNITKMINRPLWKQMVSQQSIQFRGDFSHLPTKVLTEHEGFVCEPASQRAMIGKKPNFSQHLPPKGANVIRLSATNSRSDYSLKYSTTTISEEASVGGECRGPPLRKKRSAPLWGAHIFCGSKVTSPPEADAPPAQN
jgi:hypothetical protein